MANTISFKLKVGDDGTFDIIVDKAKKASKATDNLGKSTDGLKKKRNDYSKQEKGVGGLTNNSTKAFAKQAQTIGGGNFGLVGAYAALMANVFALSQAFGFLNRAAGVQQLISGLQETGAVGGRNLKAVAENLREISGGAISAADAMKSVALGTSAGFSQSQMEGLAKVATGASKALGRDLTDAMDRLTRGAAKLESEIVDELGIMIRLDDVTNDFAASVGKTAEEVTNFEKRMAFTNEIITQGQKKFGDLADSVEDNPYSQLAATFTDLSHAIANTLNMAVKPFIGFLAGSPTALLAVISIIGAKIASSVVPALGGMMKGFSESAKASATFAKQNQKAFFRVNALSDATKEVQERFKQGNVSMEDHGHGLRTLSAQRAENIRKLKEESAAMSKDEISLRTKRYKNQAVAIKNLKNSVVSSTTAQVAHKQAQALSYLEAGKYNLMLKKLIISFKVANVNVISATRGMGLYSKALIFAKVNAMALAGALKVLGIAFLQAIPIIGLVITGLMMLKDAFMFVFRLFVKENPVTETMKEQKEAIDKFSEASSKYVSDMAAMTNANDRFARSNKTSAGLISQTVEMLNDLDAAERSRGKGNKLGYAARKGVRAAGGGLADNIKAMQAATEEGSPSFIMFNAILEKTKKVTKATTKEGLVKAKNELGALGLAANSFESNLAQATEGQKTFNTELTKVLGKRVTAYDGLNKQMKVHVALLKTQKEADSLTGVGIAGQAAVLQKILKTKKQITQADIDAFNASAEALDSNIDILAQAKEAQALEAAKLKDLKEYAGQSSQLYAMSLQQEDVLLNKKLEAVDAEIAIQQSLVEQGESSYRLTQLEIERAKLAFERRSEEEKAILIAQKQIGEALKYNQTISSTAKGLQAVNKEMFKQGELQSKIARDSKKSGITNSNTITRTEISRRKLNRDNEFKHIEAVHKIEMTRIDLDFMLLDLKARLLIKELEIKGVEADNIRAQVQAAGKAADAAQLLLGVQKENAKLQYDATTASMESGLSIGNSGISASGNGAFGTLGSMMSSTESVTVGEGAEATTTAATPLGIPPEAYDTAIEKMQIFKGVLQSSAAAFKDLGPDGAIVAGAIDNISGGMDTMIESMKFFEEEAVGTKEKAGAAFSAIAGGLGSVIGLLGAQAKMKTRAIDKEIAAEKKRDGQSVKSLALIKKMEKDKEKIDRKAFETKKKLMIAQAIMSTAAGIAMTLGMTGGFGIPLAIMVGALGAAQVAIISKMQFDGGGGTESASAPSEITVGSRQNSIDLANSNNASGELGYMRGEQGIGNASNFKPAFTGTRYRAEGGRVGYMVGEQGPELFMPDSAGEVVSAGETEEALGGTASNVTFNINTLDASGVEDILLSQRGNIIGMIRDSANNIGEEFLEGVVE